MIEHHLRALIILYEIKRSDKLLTLQVIAKVNFLLQKEIQLTIIKALGFEITNCIMMLFELLEYDKMLNGVNVIRQNDLNTIVFSVPSIRGKGCVDLLTSKLNSLNLAFEFSLQHQQLAVPNIPEMQTADVVKSVVNLISQNNHVVCEQIDFLTLRMQKMSLALTEERALSGLNFQTEIYCDSCVNAITTLLNELKNQYRFNFSIDKENQRISIAPENGAEELTQSIMALVSNSGRAIAKLK